MLTLSPNHLSKVTVETVQRISRLALTICDNSSIKTVSHKHIVTAVSILNADCGRTRHEYQPMINYMDGQLGKFNTVLVAVQRRRLCAQNPGSQGDEWGYPRDPGGSASGLGPQGPLQPCMRRAHSPVPFERMHFYHSIHDKVALRVPWAPPRSSFLLPGRFLGDHGSLWGLHEGPWGVVAVHCGPT